MTGAAACALALVLLHDASGSVAASQWALQMQGTAAALEAPAVVAALARRGPVAVLVLAYAEEQAEVAPWRILAGPEDAAALAAELRPARRPLSGWTATGDAVMAALAALADAPCQPEDSVIDVVTDGASNSGVTPPARAREAAIAAGVRINGLGVLTARGEPDPAGWLREAVVTPGGFAVEAVSWGAFAAAMRRKLAWEIASRGGAPPGG